ncbi:Dyp-type peroxidase [Runella zeae]|uniref:Dyp-type peroxidase n=1 Tax=Runella zeae TaxID=94255 RepID=UPI00041D0CEF|nr:Dyp-type peroxidase [Runella zeae]
MKSPIDFNDISTHSFLSKIQGNILKGHGRDHTTHIFVRFDRKKNNIAIKWLKEYASTYLTSCLKQLVEREEFKKAKKQGDLFSAIFFTKSGLEYLKGDMAGLNDEAFCTGMKNRNLQDPPKKNWEKGYREEIDMMLLLADDDTIRMGNFAKDVLEKLSSFSSIRAIEYGHTLKNANGDGLEHFGYVDGVSQPFFLKDEIDAYQASSNSIIGEVNFDPSAEINLVLFQDPYVADTEAMGSYFVFRKLEQNVRGFKKAEKKLGLGEIAGAYIIGRFEDGTPVIIQGTEGMSGGSKLNNFNYDNDPSGGRCPHFAHIRKTNPRRTDEDKSHIMARRGIPFGHREVPIEIDQHYAQMPEGDVGLLFMSYQASIEKQFEFIQVNWANEPNFEHPNTGLDPIIGQPHLPIQDNKYNFPKSYGTPTTDKQPFKQFVTMKGGEYFFAPSILFFSNL